MFELLEKVIMTGIGVASYSQKKGEELLAEMKERFKVTEDEGKAFLDKLQQMAKESKEKVSEMAESEVKQAIDRLGLVGRDEFERLKRRVEELEGKAGSQ